MNLSETLSLLDKLNSIGAKHFKSQDFEISMQQAHTAAVVAEIPHTTNVAPPPPAQYTPSQIEENTRKAQELMDLLKLKDEELVNRIFPAGA